MKLITYLPVSRLNDIEEYQVKNIKLLRPESFIIFVDHLKDTSHVSAIIHDIVKDLVEVQVYAVNVGNKSETLLMSLEAAKPEDVIVDSDVVLSEDFVNYYKRVLNMQYKLAGVADAKSKPTMRDFSCNDFICTKIVLNKRGHSPVFFGPKQAIIVNHEVDKRAISALFSAIHNIPKQIRDCIADETILGLYALMIGQQVTPWLPAAYNALASGGSDACNRHIRAYAHYLLFKAIHINGLPKFIKTRYFISALIHW